MTEQELKVIKRAVTNILESMLKLRDAPCSSEMHLIESVVDLAEMLNLKDFKDAEMNEQYLYCLEIMDSLRNNIKKESSN